MRLCCRRYDAHLDGVPSGLEDGKTYSYRFGREDRWECAKVSGGLAHPLHTNHDAQIKNI